MQLDRERWRDLRRTARRRLLTMHFQSGVGHLGGSLSCLDALLVLYHWMLGADDRFVLSKGHAAGALYVALWSAGRLSDADLDTFHRDDTLLAGHPPAAGINDILFATGSLGHGICLAGGLALSARDAGSPRRIFCLTSDGEWQEGSTWEALIFAAHHRLANLTILVDVNGLQGFGRTADVASLNLEPALRGFGVELDRVDGHDPEQLMAALNRTPGRGPQVIAMTTRKGNGVSFLENRLESHYLPLSASVVPSNEAGEGRGPRARLRPNRQRPEIRSAMLLGRQRRYPHKIHLAKVWAAIRLRVALRQA
jgi:transketolase